MFEHSTNRPIRFWRVQERSWRESPGGSASMITSEEEYLTREVEPECYEFEMEYDEGDRCTGGVGFRRDVVEEWV